MNTTSLSDLHAAIHLAQEAVYAHAQRVAFAESEANGWNREVVLRSNAAAHARRILTDAVEELAAFEAYMARPIDGTDEASALATAEALLNGRA